MSYLQQPNPSRNRWLHAHLNGIYGYRSYQFSVDNLLNDLNFYTFYTNLEVYISTQTVNGMSPVITTSEDKYNSSGSCSGGLKTIMNRLS